MKSTTTYFTVLSLLFILNVNIYSQDPHLDVEGDVKIRGNIVINHPDDTTSVYIGRLAGNSISHTTFRKGNSFFGNESGRANTTGGCNSFFGYQSGRANMTGGFNSFFGYESGWSNTTGNRNSFFGYESGRANMTGGFNSFFGYYSGHSNTTGGFNSFFGYYSGSANTTGDRNSFFGYKSGFSHNEGDYNTAIGYDAGVNIGKGSQNTFIGALATAESSVDSLVNSAAIGYGAKVGCDYCAVIGGTGSEALNVGIGTTTPETPLDVNGNIRSHGITCRSGVNGTYGNNIHNIFWSGSSAQLWIDVTNVGTIQLTSDRRLKKNIHLLTDHALDRIMALRPLQYQYKDIENTIFQSDGRQYEGFVADELQEIIPSAVNGSKNDLTSEGGIQPQTINSLPLIAVLTKAMQEQQSEIEALKKELLNVQEMEKKIEKLEQMILSLTSNADIED